MIAVENSGNSGGFGENCSITESVAEAKEEPGEATGYEVGGCYNDKAHEEGEQNAT